MADVKSLAVRGIRSFGPDEGDEQRVTFEKPLTLILGQNGCGKTTIIECLRYAITGQMPPGSRNECFVHDPKVNGTTEVLGQVKLKILNAKDKQLEVVRSMRVTALQKKKTRFQTLDSFLSVIEPSGKTTDISSRCKDLDNTIHEELGVSKAILNSVIFCHQEDSSWPLDEGKKVKERFDEIFDSDKYSDCFDRLRKIRKEHTNNIKLLEQEVAHLSEKQDDLNKKKIDVVNTETKISEAELKVAELAQELKPVSEKLTAIATLEKNLVSFESKKAKIKARLEHCQTQEQELNKSIKTPFEGTMEALQENITNYGATAKAKQKELKDSYKKNSSFNEQEEKIANEKAGNDIKYNKFILMESQNQERIDKRNKMIVDTGKLVDLELPEIVSSEDAEKGMNNLKEKLSSLKKELEDLRAVADGEERKLQSFVDDSRDALSRHKQKISNKEQEINNNHKEIAKLEKNINDANQSKSQLEVLEKKVAEAEEEHKKAEEEMNVEESQKEINEDEKVMEEHEQELEQIDKKITILQKQSAKLKERDMIEESLKQKEKQYNVLKNKHKTALTEILTELPEKNYAVAVRKVECEIRAVVDSIKKNLKGKQTETTKAEAERKHVRETLTERRGALTAAEDQMYKACGAQTYDATLAKLNANVEKLQEEQNLLQSSLFIIAKYKSQLQDNNCCPLCSRGFDSDTEVTDLISQLTTQVMNVPGKLEKVTEELQKSSAKKDELLGMKSLNEKIITLKEKDIPQVENRLSDIDKKIQSLTETVEELTTSLVEPEQKLQTIKQVQGDMPLLDRYYQEIQTTTKNLESVKAKCADFETGLNLEDAIAMQKDLKQKISTLRVRVRAARARLTAHTRATQQLAAQAQDLRQQFLNVQKKVQEIFNLQEKLKQLESNREKFEVELKELKEGVAPLDAELKQKEISKNETIKKNRGAIDAKRSYVSKYASSYEKVRSVEIEIKQHKEKNIQQEMDKLKEANEKLLETQKQIVVERDTLTKKIDSLKDELAKQEIYKRDLDDNMKLRKAQIEITNCEKDLEDIKEKMSGVNMDMLTEKESLIGKQTELFRGKAQTEGQLKELKDRLKQVKLELKKAQTKDVEKKYREKKFELHVTKALDKDIKDYSVALEKSLMEFHRGKMQNINHIIRGMWRKIYRGNDIDHIEIKTEGSMTTDSERRKYDYRVVQYKNGNEIDMRGRCSAGQKVLACLIIRLALAETFSARFGILALDEPTTNLDQENIRSLCSALGEIVQERMLQKNFMFIIITHDKDFIESLGQIDKVSHYYEVSRNDDGKSRVKRIRFA